MTLLGPAQPARAAVTHPVLTNGGRFIPGSDSLGVALTIFQGDSVLLVNGELPFEGSQFHDLVHRDLEPRFAADLTRSGQVAPVTGVETLEPGTYPFWCTVHRFNMRGTLEVR